MVGKRPSIIGIAVDMCKSSSDDPPQRLPGRDDDVERVGVCILVWDQDSEVVIETLKKNRIGTFGAL